MEEILKYKKILAFSAHPDDLEFGCAGTVAKLTGLGKEVSYCIITNGEKGIHNAKVSSKEMIEMREGEQREAAETVGVSRVIFLGEADGTLENTLDLRKKIVRVIRQERPDMIFSFDPANTSFENFYRFHRDHRVGAEAVFDSVYPAAGSDAFFPELISEGFMPHQIKGMWLFGSPNPDLFIDIAETISEKIKSIKCFECQFNDMDSVEKKIRERAESEGRKNSFKYAESFRKLLFD